MTFNTHELRKLGVDVQSSIRQLLHTLQCKPVGTILIKKVAGRQMSGLCNVYNVTDVLNKVAIYESTVKRKVLTATRVRATRLFLEFLSSKEMKWV